MNEQSQDNQQLEEQPAGIPPPTPEREPSEPQSKNKSKSIRQFAIGFLGWYLAVGLFYSWLVYAEPAGSDPVALTMLLCPIQGILLLILFLAKDLRIIAFGMLSAIGLNLLISVTLGLIVNALCFIPFFDPVY